jgi:hypothetical protein
MTTARTNTRVYLVTETTTGTQRLIRATYRTTAIRHAAQDKFSAHKATHDELERLITAGVRVEQAIEQAPEPADPDFREVGEQFP